LWQIFRGTLSEILLHNAYYAFNILSSSHKKLSLKKNKVGFYRYPIIIPYFPYFQQLKLRISFFYLILVLFFAVGISKNLLCEYVRDSFSKDYGQYIKRIPGSM